MSHSPKVSICIPSYNHARFLHAAIESALAQTYPNIEIVIVDDGSTDGSLEIAESYASKYPLRVSVYTHSGHRNLGISATVNECFKRSTGVYFSGLPSDDMLLPEKTEQQVEYLESHPEIGWVYGPAEIVDAQGNSLSKLLGFDITDERDPIESAIVINSVAGMTVLARRHALEQVGPHTEGLIYSDWEFWVRMISQFKVGFLEAPLVKHRIHTYNTSVGVESEEDLNRGLAVMDSLQRNAPRYGGTLEEPKVQALIEFQRMRYLYCEDKKDEAAKSLNSVIQIYPSIQNTPDLLFKWVTSPYPQPADVPSFCRWLIEHLTPKFSPVGRGRLFRRLQGLSFARQAMACYQAGALRKARLLAIRAQVRDPRWILNRHLVSLLIGTILGTEAMKKARAAKLRLFGRKNRVERVYNV
jgi:alpha-1,3-rhamnosyltransferase